MIEKLREMPERPLVIAMYFIIAFTLLVGRLESFTRSFIQAPDWVFVSASPIIIGLALAAIGGIYLVKDRRFFGALLGGIGLAMIVMTLTTKPAHAEERVHDTVAIGDAQVMTDSFNLLADAARENLSVRFVAISTLQDRFEDDLATISDFCAGGKDDQAAGLSLKHIAGGCQVIRKKTLHIIHPSHIMCKGTLCPIDEVEDRIETLSITFSDHTVYILLSNGRTSNIAINNKGYILSVNGVSSSEANDEMGYVAIDAIQEVYRLARGLRK